MKRILLLALLCANVLAAVDLTGEWRHHTGDDARWAAPDFDDRDWARVTLPGAAASTGSYWLRRQVRISETIEAPAVALGMFHSSYEVFLDGVKVAEKHPSFQSGDSMPWTFPLSRGLRAGETVTLALRVQSRPVRVQAFAGLPDFGPYLLASRENTEAALEVVMLRYRQAMTLTLVAAALQLAFGLLLAVYWKGGARSPELAWLSATLLCFGVRNALLVATAYRAVDGRVPLVLLVAGLGCLASSLSVLSRRSPLTLWVWTAVLTALVAVAPNAVEAWIMLPAYAVVAIATGQVARQPDPQRRFVWPMLLYLAAVGNAAASRWPGWPFPPSFFIGPFQVYLTVWVSTLFGMVAGLMMIQNAARERREKARLAREMEAARTVQQLLIPAVAPPGIDAVYLPAAEVGGDFWHYSDGLLVVGDVSGKGLKAAMVVSLITGMLDRRHSTSPAAVLAELNRALQARLDGGFVTCCVLRIEGEGRAVVASAGHPAPYVDGAELALATGLPLGMVAEAEYEETSLRFDRQLTLVSDGVVEAENAARELFGFDRTRAIATESAQAIAEAAKQWGQNDDITVVTVRRVNA